MKNKSSNKVIVLQSAVISFENLGILSKRVVMAQVKGKYEYYVWVEDYAYDDEVAEIPPVPLEKIKEHNPNVCKNKQTALELFNYFVDCMQYVNPDTIAYYESKSTIDGA